MMESTVRKFLYYPTRLARDAPLPAHASGAREVFLDGANVNGIHGLYWPPPDGRPVVLFLHGNAETVFEWALIRAELAALDCGLLIIDYPGYGKSPGTPTEEGLYAAAAAAVAFLRREVGDLSRRVVVHGKSLGGAVATWVAAETRVLGVILESTFQSIPHMAKRHAPVPLGKLLRSERFDSVQRVPRIGAPVLIIHGDRDELIPLAEAQAMYAAAAQPKELWVVPNAGHNDVSHVVGERWGERLRTWLDGVMARGGAR